MMKENLPVVTVSVSAYNSSKYVVETLESIKAQTYPYLILRICDDCSTDETVAICREWIEKNKSRFVEQTLFSQSITRDLQAMPIVGGTHVLRRIIKRLLAMTF